MTGIHTNPGGVMPLVNQPLYMEPAYAQAFFYHLCRSQGMDISDWEAADKPRQKAITHAAEISDTFRYRIQDGVAIVPVVGPLSHRSGWFGMGYRGIAKTVHTALQDPEVKGVFLDMETPGGTVAGCFDFAQQLRQWGQEKPIWALVNDLATSAGMAISSAAGRRLITQSGITGSIGVVALHVDYSAMLKDVGIKPTLVHAGAHKVDGNPYQKLPAEVRGRWQTEMEDARLEFATLVSDHLGLSVDAMLETEAQTYTGQDAIDIGLADQLVNSYEAIGEFAEFLQPTKTDTTLNYAGTTMSKQEQQAAAQQPHPQPPAPAKANGGDDDTPTPAPAAANTPTPGVDTADVAKAERERIASIMGHESAAALSSTAAVMAYDLGLDADQASKVMEAAAKDIDRATASQPANDPVGRLMAQEEQPNVPSDGGPGAEADESVSDLDAVASFLPPARNS